MTVQRADAVIRAAHLSGFGGECGRVAIAINRVLFRGEGRYVVATNPTISERRGAMFMGHVTVEWRERLFDATGVVDDEHAVEAWGMVDHTDPDHGDLTEEQALDGQLHYIDDLIASREEQEDEIRRGTRGRRSLRQLENSLREALRASAT
jgi:hypothetical protein